MKKFFLPFSNLPIFEISYNQLYFNNMSMLFEFAIVLNVYSINKIIGNINIID